MSREGARLKAGNHKNWAEVLVAALNQSRKRTCHHLPLVARAVGSEADSAVDAAEEAGLEEDRREAVEGSGADHRAVVDSGEVEEVDEEESDLAD